MELDKTCILVTNKKFTDFHDKVYSFDNLYPESEKIFDKRRRDFLSQGLSSFWFNGFPVVTKKLEGYDYIDIKDIGSDFNKFLSVGREEVLRETKNSLKLKVILLTKEQFDFYAFNIKEWVIYSDDIHQDMVNLGYNKDTYRMFKGVPVVYEIRNYDIILRDFSELTNNVREWTDNFHRIPNYVLLRCKILGGAMVLM